MNVNREGEDRPVRLGEAGPEGAGPETALGPSPGESPPSVRRVLVVDDNRDGAESLAMLIEMSGHAIRTAHSGPEALDAAGEFVPEVVFLDIGLPGMDGYELARRLTRNGQAPLLIALTGYGQSEDKARAEAAGFDHHFVKPADPRAIQKVIAHFDGGRSSGRGRVGEYGS